MSFFTCNSDSESDVTTSDSENEQEQKPSVQSKDEEEKDVSRKRTLPSPIDAITSGKIPKFVTTHLRNDLDWDKIKKEAPPVPEKEIKPWALKPVTIQSTAPSDHRPDIALTKQVPQTLVPKEKVDQEDVQQPEKIVDHAIKWSKMYKDTTTLKGRPIMDFDDPEMNTFCYTDVNKDKNAFKRSTDNKNSKDD